MSVSILKALINALDTGSGGVSDYIEDVYKAWMAIVVCGFVCGLVCSCLWITFIRYFAGVMAWMTIFSINAILWLVTLFCAMRGGLIGSDGRLGGGPHPQSPSGVGDPGKNGALVFMASAASRGARKPIEVVFLGQRRRPRERRRSARSRRDAAEKRPRASPELDAWSGRE